MTLTTHEPESRSPSLHPQSSGWSVEIYLAAGGIVRERTFAGDSREAIEKALARSYIIPAQVNGIAAYPTHRVERPNESLTS